MIADTDVWARFRSDFKVLSHSLSIDEFDDKWAEMVHEYESCAARALEYVTSQWFPHKESWAVAWTVDFKHYGHVTSNRVESVHAALKATLTYRQGRLMRVVKAVLDLSEVQKDRVEAEIATGKHKAPQDLASNNHFAYIIR